MDEEKLVSLKDAAIRFGISQSHLALLARTGRLKSTKMGRDWFTTPDAVREYLANPTLRSKDPYKHKRA